MCNDLRNRLYATVLSVCALAFAATGARADIQTLRDSDSSVWIEGGTSLLNYKEPSTPPNLPDSEHGFMPSFALGANYLIPTEARGWTHDLYMALEAANVSGNATYNGAYLASPTVPLTEKTSENIWTLDGQVGKAFAFGDMFMFIPYGEIGYRYWGRGTDSENYDNWEASAGAKLQFSPIQRLIFSVYGSAGTTFAASMNTGGMNFDLGSAPLYKFGGKIGVDITPRVELFTSLDYDAFRYVESSVNSYGLYELTSKTEDTAFRVGLAYHFH